MASIYDVAKRAGVAKSTVSKVLNGYPGVSIQTQEKVQAAVQELGYVPNSAAISLSKKAFCKIGILIDMSALQYADEINMQYLKGAFEQAQQLHLDVVTFFAEQFVGFSSEEIASYLKAERVNCILMYGVSPQYTALLEIANRQDFYCVLVDTELVNDKTSAISINHAQAQYEVAKLTIASCEQCETVLYLTGSQGYATSQKLKGITKLQQEMGFRLIVKNAEYREKQARKFVFQYADEIDVIVCASDIMAIGAVFALTELDIFHPVCGFDGLNLTGYTQVAVNTIKQDFLSISKHAVTELDRLIHGAEGRFLVQPHEIATIRYLDIIK